MTSQKLTNELITEIKLPKKVENPIVLLFGGYQGSGKTTVIELVKDDLNLVVISPDQIRYKLIQQKHAINDDFRRIVEETALKLFKYFYGLGYSIVVDTNLTPFKIKEIQDLLPFESHTQHRSLLVYLETSTEELVKRLNSRTSSPNKYTGTVKELYASMEKYGEIDKSVYDLVVSTENSTADEIAEMIMKFIHVSVE